RIISHESLAETGIVSRETLSPNPLIFLIRAKIDKQIRTPEDATTLNARLNLRRKAAGFILRMFQLHDHRPREENSMFRSLCLNRRKPAKTAPFPG
ncbi:MAG: hypothetical protein II779_10120, partial [Clostridia bacterium]|nr:hypothetical protein [Clostridia bacterium]